MCCSKHFFVKKICCTAEPGVKSFMWACVLFNFVNMRGRREEQISEQKYFYTAASRTVFMIHRVMKPTRASVHRGENEIMIRRQKHKLMKNQENLDQIFFITFFYFYFYSQGANQLKYGFVSKRHHLLHKATNDYQM